MATGILIDIYSFVFQGGFAAIDAALNEVDRKDVKGIGISGQQHGFVPMDGDGQVSQVTGHTCNVMVLTH